ncbi:hypothetical protein H072_9553 [Dactylellina haptotyla CBS 200.50]|uniref:Phosphotransferase n=1 Tax=Dactylellina haptotyla (strain CBS 200.50) TaxID=1284197 RepID=S8A2H3_DACHA|nr:hypothetical protein H072_9553 [Dactylellina haptotyla CBS 200.50]
MAPGLDMDQVKATLERELPLGLSTSTMLQISSKLTAAYEEGLQKSTASMLASHIYHLPSGYEKGYFLSVDLGGSTLRVALVQLVGHKDAVRRGGALTVDQPKPMSIVEIKTWGGVQIEHLKTLTGDAFFDWIAVRIREVVVNKFGTKQTPILPLGLSWSFPIESTSIDSGKLQGMGKGFRVAEGLLGTDLKAHFMNAFSRQDLNISLEAIINDSLAALLSHAYVSPATRCALILGTGTNAAVSLPLSMLPNSKLHSNQPAEAREVLMNTELSMYGKDIYPVTKWDDELDAAMPRPGFQPLEYLIGGGYMGEIGRRLIVELRSQGLFQNMPTIWEKPYTLPTEVLANMEELRDENIPDNYNKISSTLPDLDLPVEDAMTLRKIADHISTRAANYCAIALHAMIKLRERGGESPSSHPEKNIVPIAFVGSVMEKYPRLLARSQQALDKLTEWTPESKDDQLRIVLEFAPESAIFGAAVSVAAALEKKLLNASSSGVAAPTSLPHTERSSNASTLLQPGSGMEEENKSLDSMMTNQKGAGEPQASEQPFGGAEEAGTSSPRKQPFWLRLKTFFHDIFHKMFSKKRQA